MSLHLITFIEIYPLMGPTERGRGDMFLLG